MDFILEEDLQAAEIVAKLRQANALIALCSKIPNAVHMIGVTQATCCRRRSEYGELQLDHVKRMKELEQENAPTSQGGL